MIQTAEARLNLIFLVCVAGVFVCIILDNYYKKIKNPNRAKIANNWSLILAGCMAGALLGAWGDLDPTATRKVEIATLVCVPILTVSVLWLFKYLGVSDLRSRLRAAARQIAENHQAHAHTSKWAALRKLFLQERRDRSLPNSPIVGWKRGELAEVFMAKNSAEVKEEWGDVGYYLAQSFSFFWAFYALITPRLIIQAAADKFEQRAEKGRKP